MLFCIALVKYFIKSIYYFAQSIYFKGNSSVIFYIPLDMEAFQGIFILEGNAAAPAAAAKSLQSCPTLWDPIDCNPPGSSVPGILQAR